MDRFLYPLVLAIPIAIYALVAPRVPPEIGPTLAVIPLLIVVAILEIVRPFHGPWSVRPGQKHLGRDFAYTMILLPIVIAICDLILRPIDVLAGLWPRQAPLALQVVLAVLLGELSFYWLHRVSHHVPLLWRFHKKHHSVTEVHWLNSGMFHVIDAFLNFFFYFLPLRLLGVPDPVFGWFIAISLSTGVLEHANFQYDSGPLKLVFNTAELHRFHHSAKEEISQRNYGKITCFWDLVFGTYFLSADRALVLNVGAEATPPGGAGATLPPALAAPSSGGRDTGRP